MGFKLKDSFFLVPNTDPTRTQNFSYTPGACRLAMENWLFNLEVRTNQFYLPPWATVGTAESLAKNSRHALVRVPLV